MTTTFVQCGHCGMTHIGPCPRIKAIEYYPNGTMKRVEYHELRTGIEATKVTLPPYPTVYGPSGLSNACEQDEGA